MIRLLRIGVALVALWSLWWFGAGFAARSGITAWFDEQSARGWQAEFSGIGTTGYPSRHRTRIENPVLADPETGVAWRADWLQLDSRATRPGQQTLHFPQTRQRLSYFDKTLILQARDMQAALSLAPSDRFRVDVLGFTSGPWVLDGDNGRILSGDTARLSMQRTEAADTYDIALDLPKLSLGPAARQDLGLPDTLAERVETLSLDMQVGFSRPWDMRAITDNRPQPRMIKLTLAELAWGDLIFQAAGRLEVDEAGVPTGSLTVKAENWRDMLAVATTSGALPKDLHGPLASTLTALSRIGGNPDALDIKLTFRNGRMLAGVIPLGPAPRILLR